MIKCKWIQLIIAIVLITCVLLVARVFQYVLAEFIFRSHVYVTSCSDCFKEASSRKIPDTIHQVFFFETSQELPKHLVEAQQTWIKFHPTYNYTLWNKTMVDKLIDRHYPQVKHLYDSYDHWVKRADVARYLIVHQHGGWYLDLDIKCMHSLDEVRDEALAINKSIVVRNTQPFGFSNDFIGVIPRHPFIDDVIMALPHSNRWYIVPYASTVFSTGPTFFWGRFLNYPDKHEFHVLDDYSRWLQLLHASSWHSWDGLIVWFFFKDGGYNFWIFLWVALVTSAVVFVIYCNRLKNNAFGHVYRKIVPSVQFGKAVLKKKAHCVYLSIKS